MIEIAILFIGLFILLGVVALAVIWLVNFNRRKGQ
jgi:hypothetical protein